MHEKVDAASVKSGKKFESGLRARKRRLEAASFFIAGETGADFDSLSVEDKKRALQKFAIRGESRKDLATEKESIAPDLDGKGVLALLREAGLEVDDIIRISEENQDKYAGRVVVDTRNLDASGVKNEGGSLLVNPDGNMQNSCTRFVYEILTKAGLIKTNGQIGKFVNFVTEENNKDYDPKELWKGKSRDEMVEAYNRSLRGLQHHIGGDEILDLFKKKGNPEVLSNAFLANHFAIHKGKKDILGKVSENKIREMKKLMGTFEKMEEDGFIFDSGNDDIGKVAVDIARKESGKIRKILQGFDAARIYGCDSFLSWSPEENSFMLRTTKPMGTNFPQGHLGLPNMWMKERNDGNPLTMTLQEAIDKITNGKFEPQGGLKTFLEEEAMMKEKIAELKNKFGEIGTKHKAMEGSTGEEREIEITGYGLDKKSDKWMVRYRDMAEGKEFEKDEERFAKYIEKAPEEGKEDSIEEAIVKFFNDRKDYLKNTLDDFEKNFPEKTDLIGDFRRRIDKADAIVDAEERIEILQAIDDELLEAIKDSEDSAEKRDNDGSEDEFSPEEAEYYEMYEKDARHMVDFIEKIDFAGEYGYDKEDVPVLVSINIKRFWKKFKEEIAAEGLLGDKKRVEKIMEDMKNIINSQK